MSTTLQASRKSRVMPPELAKRTKRVCGKATLILGIIISSVFVTHRGNHFAEARESVMHAPLLVAQFPDILVWKWPYKNPYRWNVWLSPDNGAHWQFVSDYWEYGNARLFSPDGGSELMYIVGVDTRGKEVTLHSNVVRPDDAPVPQPKKPPHQKK